MTSIEPVSYHLGEIIFGTLFLMVSLSSALIAIMRRAERTRILIWLAIWSGLYGLRLLILSPAVRFQLPDFIQSILPCFEISSSYLILVFALLAWLELTRGKMRVFMKTMISAGVVIAITGISWYLVSGEAKTFMIYNNLLTFIGLFILLVVVSGSRPSAAALLGFTGPTG
ncbi:MAG: hypothetical protein U5R06_00475 [candidate division KSB1 bacterium]|nr:hypothetical protein [candidate division KSB1 bacterium]